MRATRVSAGHRTEGEDVATYPRREAGSLLSLLRGKKLPLQKTDCGEREVEASVDGGGQAGGKRAGMKLRSESLQVPPPIRSNAESYGRG